MSEILSCRKNSPRICQSLMKNKWSPLSRRCWSSSKDTLCCCRPAMMKEVTSLLKYNTHYPININYAWRRDVHPMDSRLQTKIKVKKPTVVRQQILEDEGYIQNKLWRNEIQRTIYANYYFIISCKSICKFF